MIGCGIVKESINAQSATTSFGCKLRLIFVDYGIGKFYIYNTHKQKLRFIEMNINLYHFDRLLFYWVLRHEVLHSRFYEKPENEGQKDIGTEQEQKEPRNINRKMRTRLALFELHYPLCILEYYKPNNMKRFSIKEDHSLLVSNSIVNYYHCEPLPAKEELRIRMYLEGL